jgi:hypothetical protein
MSPIRDRVVIDQGGVIVQQSRLDVDRLYGPVPPSRLAQKPLQYSGFLEVI